MPEMADDEGDGLGMLVLDEGEQGLGLDALEEAERPLHLGLDLPMMWAARSGSRDSSAAAWRTRDHPPARSGWPTAGCRTPLTPSMSSLGTSSMVARAAVTSCTTSCGSSAADSTPTLRPDSTAGSPI